MNYHTQQETPTLKAMTILVWIYFFWKNQWRIYATIHNDAESCIHTRVGTLIVATIYLQLIQN